MNRRQFLARAGAGATLALAAPHIRAAPAPVLRFVPGVEPAVLDPIANTAAQVRTHAFLVWDTLYGQDAAYAPQPQMLAGHTVAPDGREWNLTLRPGLLFHDGTPVLARDAVASLRRWASVDGFGAVLFAATDELAAPDDRTIRFRLNTPFPLLPNALGRLSPNIPVIMPARLAETPATTQVPEIVGSGPFRFLAAERVPGARLVYQRFDRYLPRPDGPPGFTSGPKIVHFDRVEWVVMPEAATAADALRTGEVDWLETAPPDLLPILRRDPALEVEILDRTGVMPLLRFNCLYPPFDSLAIRRAVLSAVNQTDFLNAYSNDASLWHTSGVFPPGTPMASDAGLEATTGNHDLPAARAAIAAAGYANERVVVMGPTDHPVNNVMSQVAADLFKKLGLDVDYQAMDSATMFQRRTSRATPDKGGWNCFPTAIVGTDTLDPAVSVLVRGNGPDAWYGWPNDPALERPRLAWFKADTLQQRQALSADIQREILSFAPYAPLGQILQPAAYRATLGGMLPGFAKFWNVAPAAG